MRKASAISSLLRLVLIAIVLFAFAAIIEASDSLTALINTPIAITGPDTICKLVTNNSPTGKTAYIPTTSVAEWQSFYNNPPAGVALASCAPTWQSGTACTGRYLEDYYHMTGFVTDTTQSYCQSACTMVGHGVCCAWASNTCKLYQGAGTQAGSAVTFVPNNNTKSSICPAPSWNVMWCANPLNNPNSYFFSDANMNTATVADRIDRFKTLLQLSNSSCGTLPSILVAGNIITNGSLTAGQGGYGDYDFTCTPQ